MTTVEEARAVKDRVKDDLKEIDAVNGIGITKVGDEWAVVVALEKNEPELYAYPTVIDGVRIHIQVVGQIRAHWKGV